MAWRTRWYRGKDGVLRDARGRTEREAHLAGRANWASTMRWLTQAGPMRRKGLARRLQGRLFE